MVTSASLPLAVCPATSLPIALPHFVPVVFVCCCCCCGCCRLLRNRTLPVPFKPDEITFWQDASGFISSSFLSCLAASIVTITAIEKNTTNRFATCHPTDWTVHKIRRPFSSFASVFCLFARTPLVHFAEIINSSCRRLWDELFVPFGVRGHIGEIPFQVVFVAFNFAVCVIIAHPLSSCWIDHPRKMYLHYHQNPFRIGGWWGDKMAFMHKNSVRITRRPHQLWVSHRYRRLRPGPPFVNRIVCHHENGMKRYKKTVRSRAQGRTAFTNTYFLVLFIS